MGGRGASSGRSNKGKLYGTEYKTVHKVGNIKFVTQNEQGSQKAPMETMTKGRVYALIDKNKKVLSILIKKISATSKLTWIMCIEG